MYRHLKLRMYPNNFQKVMIDKSFGYTYSHYLVEKKYENDSTITEENNEYSTSFKNNTFDISDIGFDVIKKYVLLPDFGWVKLKKRINFSGEIVSAEVSRVSDRYYLDLIFKSKEKNANLVYRSLFL